MKKKLTSSLLASTLLAGALAGCSTSEAPASNASNTSNGSTSTPASNQPITLKFASWSISEAATKGALEEMAKAFEQQHPNVKIEFVGIPFGDIKQQTFVMASSGNAPDIMQTFPSWFSTYAASDIITPVDDLVGKDYVNDILPSFKEDFSYQGKLMGVPWAPTPYILYYNKELFKKAGLPDAPPKTYDEMMDAARKISKLKTDAGEKVYGYGEATDKLAINGMIALKNIYSFGGTVLDKDGKVNVNTPEVIEALKHYQTLANEDITPQGS
ncbi:ABC transporter substrate-binding protein [Paenibacillus hexagrammi]|uniref:ABC transporter substrate-binding protein n=1 Tax=Paenibacillus hexagrammi TaxID=2908839 RepID=UPI0021A804E7|nr:extracellular solute-binding protein [Paenibacillus sp. YPD9-1]